MNKNIASNTLTDKLRNDAISSINEYCKELYFDGVLRLNNPIQGYNVHTNEPITIVGVRIGTDNAALSVEAKGYIIDYAYELQDADVNSLLSISVAIMDGLTY